MHAQRRSVRRGATGRLSGPTTRPGIAGLGAATLALALATPLMGLADASASTAAVGDEVVAWVEVEDGQISGGAAGPPAFNSGDHSNFSGTGSYTFRETGMTSTMSVEVPAAGTYPVYVRYAAGPLGPDENVTGSMGLLTNGGARQQMSLPMTSFEDWEAWRFVQYDVQLDQGANTLALQCDRGVDFCRLNFDAIQVGGTAPDPCVATIPSPGYTALFDGTFASFDAWRKAGTGGFGRQTDCSIRSFRGPGAEWLTEPQTGPYTLRVDWRRDGSNDDSTVFLASSSRGGADPVGGLGISIGADTGTIQPTGGAPAPADASAVAAAVRPLGEWNTFTIELTETSVEVFLNGTPINALETDAGDVGSGFIGLQNRSFIDEVDFRDIEVKAGVEPDLVDSTTSVVTAPATATVKRDTVSVSVEVASEGQTPTGDVELSLGDDATTTVQLVDGVATARVGPFDTVGDLSLEAHYLGDDATRPSASPVSIIEVVKATPALGVTVRPRKVVARRTTAKLVIAVKERAVSPSGKVRVRIAGSIGKKRYVTALENGRATIRLKRFRKAGTARATVTYLGDGLTESASVTERIAVKKAKKRRR